MLEITEMLEKRFEEYPNRKYHSMTYSLPKDIIKKMDADKGDISRSRYLLRLIEKAYGYKVSAEEGDGSTK